MLSTSKNKDFNYLLTTNPSGLAISVQRQPNVVQTSMMCGQCCIVIVPTSHGHRDDLLVFDVVKLGLSAVISLNSVTTWSSPSC